MIYKEYGKTGLSVSAVGFGGMRFDEEKSNEENAELILYAYEKGINFFDTAPGYSADRSEDIFGIAFRQLRSERKNFFVSTKGMPERFDTAQKARDVVDKSLERLGIDYIDFYYVWCIRKMEQYSLSMMKGGQYKGLVQAREQGKIRNITVSSHLMGEQVVDILSENKFAGVLLGVNILNFPYRWNAVESAHKNGLGVVAMNPLSGGVIPQNEKKLGFLSQGDETPTEAALRFCISATQISVALNGFTTKEQIDMACRIADSAQQFTPAQLDEIRKRVSTNMNSLCTGCGYCIKECPKNIPIPSYLQIYNERILSEKTDVQMAESLKFHHQWRCEEACTQHLDIMDRLEEISGWEASAYQLESQEATSDK